jgi:hypothetical protein
MIDEFLKPNHLLDLIKPIDKNFKLEDLVKLDPLVNNIIANSHEDYFRDKCENLILIIQPLPMNNKYKHNLYYTKEQLKKKKDSRIYNYLNTLSAYHKITDLMKIGIINIVDIPI